MSKKKKSNKRGLAWTKIFAVLNATEGVTIADIVRVTGLSRSTVVDNLNNNVEYVADFEGGLGGRVWYLAKTPENMKMGKAVVKSKKSSAKRGEAWKTICAVLNECEYGATFNALLDLTGLPYSTLADNLVAGRRSVDGFTLHKCVSEIGSISWYFKPFVSDLKPDNRHVVDRSFGGGKRSMEFEISSSDSKFQEDVACMFADVSVRGAQYTNAVMEQMANCVKELKLLRGDVAELRRELHLVDKIEHLITAAEER